MYQSKKCDASVRYEGRKKSTRLMFAGLITFALSSTVSASTIQYKVQGTFDTGNLAGLSYLEVFTFEDSSKPPVLGSTPWVTDLLSYDLDVESLSKHWTLADWPMQHTFSQFIGSNGFVNSLATLATPGPPGDIPANPPAISEFLDDGAPSSRSEHVKWYDWSVWNTFQTDSTDSNPTVTITGVPEPSTGAILLMGLATLVIMLLPRHSTCSRRKASRN